MQITVTIQPETGARFAAEAERRGIPLDRLLSETLEHTAAAAPMLEAEVFSPEEQARRNAAVDAMRAFAAKYGATTGGQSIKSMVHEGHKY